ncbi:hypothetical protein [Microbispora sp. NBRC 16548]|uniref:hypothetical protein n=1 Tax=Microbispora sp. NBRC 16548 TaxID=3030994 RepID=UPI0024A44BC8|nr:hypothetical protein [Microbispora sp. NBRC 16548]GLX03775.1 hypothetical protein Misp03_07020 [Microbispora sp. NBRC 16548]
MRLFRRGERIGDEEILTQYGNRDRPVKGRPFKDEPVKPQVANAVSLMRGKLTVDEAVRCFPNRRSAAAPGEGVRYATAGTPREALFRVRFTPNSWNLVRVSVENLDSKRPWTDDDRDRFNACFGDPEWREGDDE